MHKVYKLNFWNSICKVWNGFGKKGGVCVSRTIVIMKDDGTGGEGGELPLRLHLQHTFNKYVIKVGFTIHIKC